MVQCRIIRSESDVLSFYPNGFGSQETRRLSEWFLQFTGSLSECFFECAMVPMTLEQSSVFRQFSDPSRLSSTEFLFYRKFFE